jgi:hypothetical protein
MSGGSWGHARSDRLVGRHPFYWLVATARVHGARRGPRMLRRSKSGFGRRQPGQLSLGMVGPRAEGRADPQTSCGDRSAGSAVLLAAQQSPLASQLQVSSDTLVSSFEQAALQTFGAGVATFNVPGAVHTYVEHMGPRGSVLRSCVRIGRLSRHAMWAPRLGLSHIVAPRRPCPSILQSSKPGTSPAIAPEALHVRLTAHL